MELQSRMSAAEMKSLQQEMGAVNLANKFKKDPAKEGLGRDEFLKLLTVEMSHQDPLSPMDNKDMIAQMAQFSSLEQMSSVNKSLESMKSLNLQGMSYDLLGRQVDFITEAGVPGKGIVDSVLIDDNITKLNVRMGSGSVSVTPDNILTVHSDR